MVTASGNQISDIPEDSQIGDDKADGEAVQDSKLTGLDEFFQNHNHDEILERLEGVQLGNYSTK